MSTLGQKSKAISFFGFAVASATLILTSCGSADNSGGVPVMPINPQPMVAPPVTSACGHTTPLEQACPAGTAKLSGFNCLQGTFESVCAKYGTLKTVNGRTLCQVVYPVNFSSFYPYYLLPTEATRFERGADAIVEKANPCGTPSANTNVAVKKGDLLTLTASGGWSGWEAGHFLGMDSVSRNCFSYSTSINGRQDGVDVMNGDSPAGLMASDGTEAFFVGAGVANRMINNDGLLRLGFNISPSWDACGSFKARFTITHCEDATNTTYPCQ